MSERREEEAGELRLAPESIEALACRLADLLRTERAPEQPAPPRRLLSAAEVARWWGVERSWVYSHAERLGARRLGAGERPRLRFDPDEVAEALGGLGSAPCPGCDRCGSPPVDGVSLSARSRGTVVEQRQQVAGRRANAPGPAPKEVLRRGTKPSPAGRSRRPFAADFRGGGW